MCSVSSPSSQHSYAVRGNRELSSIRTFASQMVLLLWGPYLRMFAWAPCESLPDPPTSRSRGIFCFSQTHCCYEVQTDVNLPFITADQSVWKAWSDRILATEHVGPHQLGWVGVFRGEVGLGRKASKASGGLSQRKWTWIVDPGTSTFHRHS